MKILVVEDEPAISRILVRKIRKMGYECQSTDSVEGAKKLLLDFKPQVIFLDYILSDGRSKELASEGHLVGVESIYLMSAFMDDLNKKDFADLNVTYLKKPFTDLSAVLNTLPEKL